MPPTPSMEAFRNKLGKRYGQRLTRADEIKPYSVVSTGSMSLDYAMRTGGYLQGRIHEIFGPPGVGKTTLGILGAISHQKVTGRAVGWIDMERSFDWKYASQHGLAITDDRFTHINPDDSEDVADMARLMCQSGLYSLIVVDSIGGMESKQAFEKEAGDVVMGRNAQVITRMAKHVAVMASNHEVTVVLINQPRANLAFAGQDKPSGPKALQHATTFRIDLAAPGGADNQIKTKIDGDDIVIGQKFVARVKRSRVSPAGHKAEFWMFNQTIGDFEFGLDYADEAAWIGIKTGVIEQKGAWYTLPSGGRFQGAPNVVEALRAEPDAVTVIRERALALVAHEVQQEIVTNFEETSE